jgi:hypothetical protein
MIRRNAELAGLLLASLAERPAHPVHNRFLIINLLFKFLSQCLKTDLDPDPIRIQGFYDQKLIKNLQLEKN